jgi:pentatricopeptide repeat protein
LPASPTTRSNALKIIAPRDQLSTYLNGIGEAYFFSRRFEEAAAHLLASLDLAPSFPVTYRVLAACYAHMGRLDDAREIVRRLRAITPAVMEPGTRYRTRNSASCFCRACVWRPAKRAEEPADAACHTDGQ